MPFNLIAISRTLGSGGEDLGLALAQQLNMRYVDAEIIVRAAQQADTSPGEIARAEAPKPFLARILENLGRGGGGALAAGGMPEFMASATMPTLEEIIVDVIKEIAREGNAVIVAHGASIPLAGTPDLLRVMVTASLETRANRVATEKSVAANAARSEVEDSDRARAEYFRRFYKLDRELPTHYDITVNTDVLSIEDASKLILMLAQR